MCSAALTPWDLALDAHFRAHRFADGQNPRPEGVTPGSDCRMSSDTLEWRVWGAFASLFGVTTGIPLIPAIQSVACFVRIVFPVDCTDMRCFPKLDRTYLHGRNRPTCPVNQC